MFAGKIGVPELLLIVVIVLIVFGAGKLPAVGGSVGKAIRDFRNSMKGDDDQKLLKEEHPFNSNKS